VNLRGSVQEARASLITRVEVICQQRALEQLALHCSPSLSLSQTCGTPAESALGNAPAAYNPEQPWQHLFQHRRPSARALQAPAPRRSMRHAAPESARSAGAGQRAQPFAPRASSIGTPPSVEPKLHQARGAPPDRTYSVGSLRRGALSFSSAGQGHSDSLNLEGAHSDLSFMPDVSAELPLEPAEATASVDGTRSVGCSEREAAASRSMFGNAAAPPPSLQLPPRRPPQMRKQTGPHAPPRAPLRRSLDVRGTPRSVLGAQGFGGSAAADESAAARAQHADDASVAGAPSSSIARRCRPPPPITVADSPFITGQADALDRFWTSQTAASPQVADAESARRSWPATTPLAAHAPRVDTRGGTAGGMVASLTAPAFAPCLPAGAAFSAQALPRRGAVKAQSHLPVVAAGGARREAGHCVRTDADARALNDACHSELLASTRESCGRLKTSSAFPKTKGGAMVDVGLQADPAEATKASLSSDGAGGASAERWHVRSSAGQAGGAACAQQHSSAVGRAITAVARNTHADEDSIAMPAPPARRSRGARIAGLVVGQENRRSENAPSGTVMGGTSGARSCGAQPRAGRAKNGATTGAAGKEVKRRGPTLPLAPIASSQHVRSAQRARKTLSRQQSDTGALPGVMRPELNRSLPLCRLVGQHH
jgi:hypothetical protein